MRKIKFRAWDRKVKVMVKVGKLTWNKGWLQINNRSEGSWNPRHILLQFTGLKDSKGKEIYEGDILRVREGFLTHSVTEGIIKWRLAGFIIDWVDGEQYHNDFGRHANEFEIIGNIYENPVK